MFVMAVLASGWFVPVSCSTATAVLAQVAAADSERAWTPQDKPDPASASSRARARATRRFACLRWPTCRSSSREQAQDSFLMDQDSGRIDNESQHEWVIYRVLSRTPAGQEIEVDHEDGDDERFSRYRATATDIEPISTRYGAISRGLVIGAVVNGFVVALIIFVTALILKPIVRRRLAPPALLDREPRMKKDIQWLDAPEPHNYPAACPTCASSTPDRDARRHGAAPAQARMSAFKAKDIFRASGLSLLGVSNLHVEKDRAKIKKGKRLSPLLLVRDTALGKVVVADGYHRLCAVYSFDEDARIPCKIA